MISAIAPRVMAAEGGRQYCVNPDLRNRTDGGRMGRSCVVRLRGGQAPGRRIMDVVQALARSTNARSRSDDSGIVARYAAAASLMRWRSAGSVALACSISTRKPAEGAWACYRKHA